MTSDAFAFVGGAPGVPLAALARRAADAADAGAPSFPVPEAAGLVARVAASPVTALRAEAAAWSAHGSSYHELVRLSARHVLALAGASPAREAIYVPKAAAELEPLLALWPSLLILPTAAARSPRELVHARAHPVHALGVVAGDTWADGHPSSPAEFFFHDLDHARFKVREDLRVLGIDLDDPYQDGTTFDATLGRHRTIAWPDRAKIGAALWQRSAARAALATRLLAHAEDAPGASLAAACELLLFEILHEKGHALEPETLRMHLADPAPRAKLRRKRASGFYGDQPPTDTTLAALERASDWLHDVC